MQRLRHKSVSRVVHPATVGEAISGWSGAAPATQICVATYVPESGETDLHPKT